MDHQQNRRRAMEPGGGSGQSHPPPQPCPRCNSNNTKFCYYNNYSLTQPRYFCKGCRRYWTHGGTLRNVPVGGGCRKSKRPKLATTSPGTSSGAGTSGSHLQTMSMPPPLPPPHHQVISMMDNNNNIINNTSTTTSSNVVPMMMSHSFFGGGSPGLLSSLAAMQGVNQSLSFGSNLAMLQGFSLQNFGQQPHNQEGCIPSLYSTREVGSSSMTPSMQEWNLRMGPGPEPGPVGQVMTQASISDNDHNRNHNQNLQGNNDNDNNNNRGSTNEQWSNFMGTSGLDDP